MSKEQEPSTTLDPKTAGLPNIDTDAEHDRGAARKASNASLKREDASRGGGGGSSATKAAPPPTKAATKDEAHKSSDSASFDSVQAELKFFAHELHGYVPELRELTSQTKGTTDAGTGPAMNRAEQILANASSGVSRVREIAFAVPAADRKHLGQEISMVIGAYETVGPWLAKAASWLRGQGVKEASVAPENATIVSLAQAYGVTYDATFASDRKDPSDAAGLDAVIKSEIASAEAAVESTMSGNDNDSARVVFHIHALHSHHDRNPKAFASHKAAIKRLLKRVDEIKGKNSELSGSHNQLLDLLK